VITGPSAVSVYSQYSSQYARQYSSQCSSQYPALTEFSISTHAFFVLLSLRCLALCCFGSLPSLSAFDYQLLSSLSTLEHQLLSSLSTLVGPPTCQHLSVGSTKNMSVGFGFNLQGRQPSLERRPLAWRNRLTALMGGHVHGWRCCRHHW
jgi:hypothetical protein